MLTSWCPLTCDLRVRSKQASGKVGVGPTGGRQLWGSIRVAFESEQRDGVLRGFGHGWRGRFGRRRRDRGRLAVTRYPGFRAEGMLSRAPRSRSR